MVDICLNQILDSSGNPARKQLLLFTLLKIFIFRLISFEIENKILQEFFARYIM